MEDYSLINFIINAFLFILVAWFVAKRDKNSLVDKGNQVIIRSTVFARVFKSSSKVVNKSDIVKVQVAGKCISLFNKGNNAYDVFTFMESPTKVFTQAKLLFSKAEVVEIKG
jgi:hypothetical protein